MGTSASSATPAVSMGRSGVLRLVSAGHRLFLCLPLSAARAERERIVAIGRAELDQIAPPLGDDTGGTYTSIDLWRGPYVWRIYVTGLSCQEIHDYYAETLAKAGWSQWKAPYMKYDSDLVATYRKHTKGVSLKLILWCSLGTYEIHVIQPSFCNGQDQPEARY
jgi:hypothetical protein